MAGSEGYAVVIAPSLYPVTVTSVPSVLIFMDCKRFETVNPATFPSWLVLAKAAVETTEMTAATDLTMLMANVQV